MESVLLEAALNFVRVWGCNLKFTLFNLGQLHQVALQTEFQVSVTMDWNCQSSHAARLPINVMASVDAQKLPAAPLNQFGKSAA